MPWDDINILVIANYLSHQEALQMMMSNHTAKSLFFLSEKWQNKCETAIFSIYLPVMYFSVIMIGFEENRIFRPKTEQKSHISSHMEYPSKLDFSWDIQHLLQSVQHVKWRHNKENPLSMKPMRHRPCRAMSREASSMPHGMGWAF